MAYSCASKAVFSGPRTVAHAHRFVTVRNSTLKARAIGVAQRIPPVGRHTQLMPCKAVSEPAAEHKLQLQGSKPKLPYEVLQRAYAQEQLKNAKLQQEDQELQAKLERSEATTTKVRRIFTKGAARPRDLSLQARVLQTKFDRITSETDLVLLQITVEEKEQRLHFNLQEAEDYKQKMLCTQEEKKHEAQLQSIALAEKAAAEKKMQKLEAQRQQELQRYNEDINTEKVFGQFLYEMVVKALFTLSVATSGEAQRKQASMKPADEKRKQQARFL